MWWNTSIMQTAASPTTITATMTTLSCWRVTALQNDLWPHYKLLVELKRLEQTAELLQTLISPQQSGLTSFPLSSSGCCAVRLFRLTATDRPTLALISLLNKAVWQSIWTPCTVQQHWGQEVNQCPQCVGVKTRFTSLSLCLLWASGEVSTLSTGTGVALYTELTFN